MKVIFEEVQSSGRNVTLKAVLQSPSPFRPVPLFKLDGNGDICKSALVRYGEQDPHYSVMLFRQPVDKDKVEDIKKQILYKLKEELFTDTGGKITEVEIKWPKVTR